jgi:hypothetical protein
VPCPLGDFDDLGELEEEEAHLGKQIWYCLARSSASTLFLDLSDDDIGRGLGFDLDPVGALIGELQTVGVVSRNRIWGLGVDEQWATKPQGIYGVTGSSGAALSSDIYVKIENLPNLSASEISQDFVDVNVAFFQ